MNYKISKSEEEILKVFDDPEYEIRDNHIEKLFLRFNFDLLTSLPKNIGELKFCSWSLRHYDNPRPLVPPPKPPKFPPNPP